MTYDYSDIPDFSIQAAVKDSLMSAMSFIFERTVSMTIDAMPGVVQRAGVAYGKCEGEFAAGPQIYGGIRFDYADDTESRKCTVDFINLDMGELGWSSIPFTTDATLYDSILNKHKLLVLTTETRPTRMKRVTDACDELKSLQLPHDDQERVDAIVDKILKEIQ